MKISILYTILLICAIPTAEMYTVGCEVYDNDKVYDLKELALQ